MTSTRLPPLHVHLLFHPTSTEARGLAARFLERWMGPPASQGLRVPVFLGPEHDGGYPPDAGELNLDARRNLVVVLVDRAMTRRVGGGTCTAWAALVQSLFSRNDPALAVLPVALDNKAFELDEDLARRLFVVLPNDDDDRLARLSFFAAVRSLYLLRNQVPPDRSAAGIEAPLTLFVSHAKNDLDTGGNDPVRATRQALSELPVHDWFDARNIAAGARLDDEIRAGIERADAVVVFLTDAWASRPWCRTEALVAKELATPVLVVDALEDGEPRNFPYGGNTRTLRWRCPVRPPPGADAAAREEWQEAAKSEGRRVISGAVLEALRRLHNQCRLQGQAEAGDVVLDAAPEAAHLAHNPPGSRFLYPDPPLDSAERSLLERIDRNATFDTPMRRIARQRDGRPLATVAVSISEPPDLARLGLTGHHLRTLTDETHLYLLLAGLRIAYGGKLEPDRLTDPDNFTLRLFDLVRGYRDLAKDAGAAGLQPILNVAPWPLWKLYDDDVLDVFGSIAELDRRLLPDIGLSEDDLSPLPSGFVPWDTPDQRYAWARALTAMREHVTQTTAARLCIGGRLEGYKGRYAGLVEEPLLSLRARQPLFLVGALGGCTRLVIDLLEQRDRAEMTTAYARGHVDGYDEMVERYRMRGGEIESPEAVAQELQGFGAGGMEQALNNGLSDEENRALFRATDPRRIAELVLSGLDRMGL